MRRLITLSTVLFLTACSTTGQQPLSNQLDYSLLKNIYTQADNTVLEKVKTIRETSKETLKQPKYIRVYRGSYKDNRGNVVDAGFEYILVDDGTPDTNF